MELLDLKNLYFRRQYKLCNVESKIYVGREVEVGGRSLVCATSLFQNNALCIRHGLPTNSPDPMDSTKPARGSTDWLVLLIAASFTEDPTLW